MMERRSGRDYLVFDPKDEPERFHDNRQAKGNSGTCQPPGSLESVSFWR